MESPAAKKTRSQKGDKVIGSGSGKISFERLAHQPVFFAAENFLDAEEAAALVQTAESILERVPPPVVCFLKGEADLRSVLKASKSSDKGQWNFLTKKNFIQGSNCLDVKTSKGLLSGSAPTLGVPPRTINSFGRGESALLETVSRRIEKEFGLLEQNGQDFMWVKYDSGGEYMPHTDCLTFRSEGKIIGQKGDPLRDRFATVLISLNEDMVGGETAFSELNLSLTPKVGRALAWWNIDPKTGLCDHLSTHVAKEVKSGRKLILMRWYQYFPVYSPHRSTPLATFDRAPFTPEVSCDVGTDGNMSCRHYLSMVQGHDKMEEADRDEL